MKSIFLLPFIAAAPLQAQVEETDIPLEKEISGEATAADDKPASATEETLGEIVVSAVRDPFLNIRGTTTRIDSRTMAENGVQDLGSMVKYDPTVVVPFDSTTGDGSVGYASSGSASFNIRGIEGNRVGIEVDGIRQPPEYISTSFDAGQESGAGGMGRDYFDPSMFQLVEILKGGASAQYGSDSMGGVISMKTLDPRDLYVDKTWGGLARTQFFSRNDGLAWQLGGGGRSGGLDYLLLYAGRESNETANNGSIPPDPMSIDSSAWLAKVGYDAGDHVFQFTFEHYERNLHADMRSAIDPAGGIFTIFRQSIDNWQDVERSRLSLKWLYQPLGGWVDKVETQAYWQSATSGSRNASTNPTVRALDLGGPLVPYLPAIPAPWRTWLLANNPGLMVEGRNRTQEIEFETELYGITSFAHKTVEFDDQEHKFLFGIDASMEKSSNRFDRTETRGQVVRDLTDPLNPIITSIVTTTDTDRISFAPSETTRVGLVFQDDVKLGTLWEFSPGLRLDYHQIDTNLTQQFLDRLQGALGGAATAPQASDGYDNLTLSPRFDVAFLPTENSRVYAGYALGTRNPTAEELTMVFDHPATGASSQTTVPNPSLQEETSHAFKLGYKAEDDRGRVGVELFYTRYQDFIENNQILEVLPGGHVITTTMNQGEAEIYGIEASGEWDAGSWKSALTGVSLGLSAGYTIGQNLTKDEPVNTVEPWKAIGFIGYADPDGKYGARMIGTYTGAVTRTDDTTMNGEMFRPDSWFTLDLLAWWKPVRGLTLNAGVNNIFDEQYWNWSTVRRGGGHLGLAGVGGGHTSAVDDRTTAPGRNFFLSATWQF
ncbi:MAG: TonB-dependent hemoglobin/transferrin/lactoferrin family receptor [Akkermansiaceae bacterium]|nr:TonB-dependent hemoglobin/transferrin/lactoferrin family receptor [Akkermansiaceae bacterium]